MHQGCARGEGCASGWRSTAERPDAARLRQRAPAANRLQGAVIGSPAHLGRQHQQSSGLRHCCCGETEHTKPNHEVQRAAFATLPTVPHVWASCLGSIGLLAACHVGFVSPLLGWASMCGRARLPVAAGEHAVVILAQDRVMCSRPTPSHPSKPALGRWSPLGAVGSRSPHTWKQNRMRRSGFLGSTLRLARRRPCSRCAVRCVRVRFSCGSSNTTTGDCRGAPGLDCSCCGPL